MQIDRYIPIDRFTLDLAIDRQTAGQIDGLIDGCTEREREIITWIDRHDV